MKISDLTKKTSRTSAQAEKEKNQIEEIQAKLQEQINQLESRIPDETGKAGEVVLDDMLNNTNNATFDEIEKLKTELAGKRAALNKVNDLIPVALSNLYLAQAKENRNEARKLRDEAAKRQLKTDELLGQLFNHEQCKYVPFKPEKPLQIGHKGGDPVVMRTIIPITQAMISDAVNLEEKAERLERAAKSGKQPEKPRDIVGNIRKLQNAV